MTIAQLKPISVRPDLQLAKAIAALRRHADPIPSISDVIRQAVMEKYERDVGSARKAK